MRRMALLPRPEGSGRLRPHPSVPAPQVAVGVGAPVAVGFQLLVLLAPAQLVLSSLTVCPPCVQVDEVSHVVPPTLCIAKRPAICAALSVRGTCRPEPERHPARRGSRSSGAFRDSSTAGTVGGNDPRRAGVP